MRPEILKFIEESIEDKIIDIGFGNYFLFDIKSKGNKSKNKLGYIKIKKILHFQRTNKIKMQLQNKRKDKMYLIRG